MYSTISVIKLLILINPVTNVIYKYVTSDGNMIIKFFQQLVKILFKIYVKGKFSTVLHVDTLDLKYKHLCFMTKAF